MEYPHRFLRGCVPGRWQNEKYRYRILVRSKSGCHTNESGFSALPGGMHDDAIGFYDMGDFGNYISSDASYVELNAYGGGVEVYVGGANADKCSLLFSKVYQRLKFKIADSSLVN